MLHIIWSIIIGAIIGYIAEIIYPGAQHLGLLKVILLGICGSFLGGFITSLFSKPKEGAMFHPAGIFMSIVGALLLLFIITRFLPNLL